MLDEVDGERHYERRREGAKRGAGASPAARWRARSWRCATARSAPSTCTCLPAKLHNHPQKHRRKRCAAKIRAKRADYDEILCLYGDCGTGGELDRVLRGGRRQAHRRPALLCVLRRRRRIRGDDRGGDRHVLPDRFPRPAFRTLVYRGSRPRPSSRTARHLFRQLPQAGLSRPDRRSGLSLKAEAAAQRIGLAYERRFTGLGGFAQLSRRSRR